MDGLAGLSVLSVISVVLNGAPLDLTPPAVVVQADDLDAYPQGHIVVPVRPIFEKLGWTVEAFRGEQVSGVHLWPKETGWRPFAVRLGEKELRLTEHVVSLPTASVTHEGRAYVPVEVLAAAVGADIDYDAEAKRLALRIQEKLTPAAVSVRGLMADVGKWVHRPVTFTATFLGPNAPPSAPGADPDAPAPGVCLFDDGTGTIHCTRCELVSCVMVWAPSMSPGTRARLTGIVRLGRGGTPYVSLMPDGFAPIDAGP